MEYWTEKTECAKQLYPFSWRGYSDYGTGPISNMATHRLEAPYQVLNLGVPSPVQRSMSQVYSQNWFPDYLPECAPIASTIQFEFGADENIPNNCNSVYKNRS